MQFGRSLRPQACRTRQCARSAPLSLREAELGKMHDALRQTVQKADQNGRVMRRFRAAPHLVYSRFHPASDALSDIPPAAVDARDQWSGEHSDVDSGSNDLEIGLSLDILSVHVRDVTRTDARERCCTWNLIRERRACRRSQAGRVFLTTTRVTQAPPVTKRYLAPIESHAR